MRRVASNVHLRDVAVGQVAEFFNSDSHNHPLLYAHGDGLVVVTRFGEIEFGAHQVDEALACYRQALADLRYFSGGLVPTRGGVCGRFLDV